MVSQQVASRSASYKIRGDGDVDRVTWVCRRSRPGSVGFTCPSSHVFVFSLVILDSSAAAIHSKMLSSASRILFLLATILALTTATLHGRIESCSGWKLNKLPVLKSFLKDGEAESYRNVEVKYVPGKQAVLTIYEGEGEEVEGWVEKEKIVLSELETKVTVVWVLTECCFMCCNSAVFI